MAVIQKYQAVYDRLSAAFDRLELLDQASLSKSDLGLRRKMMADLSRKIRWIEAQQDPTTSIVLPIMAEINAPPAPVEPEPPPPPPTIEERLSGLGLPIDELRAALGISAPGG